MLENKPENLDFTKETQKSKEAQNILNLEDLIGKLKDIIKTEGNNDTPEQVRRIRQLAEMENELNDLMSEREKRLAEKYDLKQPTKFDGEAFDEVLKINRDK